MAGLHEREMTAELRLRDLLRDSARHAKRLPDSLEHAPPFQQIEDREATCPEIFPSPTDSIHGSSRLRLKNTSSARWVLKALRKNHLRELFSSGILAQNARTSVPSRSRVAPRVFTSRASRRSVCSTVT